jgi:AcrR family transcriptional regulator
LKFPDAEFRVWKMPGSRLGPTEWVNAGLEALARFGFAALKADTLASRLRVSRGSFYWHFAHVSAFHAAILRRWREIALENIIDNIDSAADDRLEALLSRAFSASSEMERAVRAWATFDAQAKANVEAVDAERIRYLRKLLVDAGIPPSAAETRARIMNWAYLGFALSSNSLDDETLKVVVGDLAHLARLKPPPFSDKARGPQPVPLTRRRTAKPERLANRKRERKGQRKSALPDSGVE